MFILPKGVLKDVDALLRKFLWTGGLDNSYGSKVAWDNVCKDKRDGGLGLKNTVHLNNVLNLKHIWSIFQNSAQSLWVKWIHTYMLKGRSFWVVKSPSTCSWSWKKLLGLRSLARQLLSHRVGNGEHTFLWYDNWHSLGPLVEKFGNRVSYDSALPFNSKVASVISNNSWAWPVADSPALLTIKDTLTHMYSPNSSTDRVIWKPSPNGHFSTAHTWDYLYGSQHTVHWYPLVWFQGAYPRHSLLLWLAIQERLNTHDRIQSYTPGPLVCTLCYKDMEDHSHLFFKCTYSGLIWQEIQVRSKAHTTATTWEELVHWAADKWRAKTTANCISRMAFGAAIYHIWKERNARTFRAEFKTKERVVQDICTYMKTCISIRWKRNAHFTEYISVWDS